MIAFLALALAVGLVLGAFQGYRSWLRVRAPGVRLQELVKPQAAEAQLWAYGLVAVATLTALALENPATLDLGWWAQVLLFAWSAFEAACWASGLYHFAFYQKGLWYGRRWYPYRDLQSYEVDRDLVRLVARGRVLSFRTVGSLSPEVRLKLAVEEF